MMDTIDKRILYELHWNCRQSNTEIGKKLRISKQVVAYRIEQLEKAGIIMSYHATLDWRVMGYNAIRVYIKWRNMDQKKEKEVHDEIKKDPLFMWSIKFEGEIDIAFYVWVKEIPEFSKKWFNFLEKYRKYIAKQEMYESVNMINYRMKPLVEDFSTEYLKIGDNLKGDYDPIDYHLLRIVTENAKIPLIEMARKINLTPKAVIYRLKKLEEKKIILGYSALINHTKIGLLFYKVDFYLNNLSRLREMIEYARQHKNIIYVMRTIGGPDYEIEVLANDVLEFKKVINEIRDNFSECIEWYRFHRFEYTLKQIYLPGENLSKVSK